MVIVLTVLMASILTLPLVLAPTAIIALMAMLWRILGFFLIECGNESLKLPWRGVGP
jgi:hypothetical protein